MARWQAVVALSLLAALAGLSCNGEKNPLTSSYELSGRVTDRQTGGAIGGATVTFVSKTLYRSSATSGKDGKYEMSVTTDSPFGQVRAEKAGWLPDEKTVYFDDSKRRIDLGLRPATP